METSTTERAGSVEFRVLGNVEVVTDGMPLALEGRKSRELLAFLLLHANEPVPAGRIVEALWGDDAPLTVDASLRVAVSKLRKALEPVGARDRLETRPSGYVVRVEPELVDAARFDALATEGHRALEGGRLAESAERLRQALGLWRGTPYQEIAACADAAPELKRLTSRRLDAQDHLAEAELGLGRHETLVPELETLVAEQPTRERRAAHLMLALYRSGRQSEALDVYTHTREALIANLGLEPGPELRELQQAILRHDPVLAASHARGQAPLLARQRRVRRPSRRQVLPLIVLTVGVAGALAWIVSRDVGARVSAPPNSAAIVERDSSEATGWTPTGSRPAEIALAGDSAWIANVDEGTITQVDVDSHDVVRTIGVGFEPTGIAGDNEGVWVVGGYDHQLARIDTSDGRVRLRIRFRERFGALPEGYERGPAGVAVGAGGVWVSHGVEMTRFDPRTGAVEKTARAGGPWASQIAIGEGFVWVAYHGALTKAGLLRFSPALDGVRLAGDGHVRVPLVGRASDVAVGDGWVWTTITRGDTVSRVDPTTLNVDRTFAAGDSPVSVAIDNGVWISNSADATVTKLDAVTGAKLDVTPVGHTLGGLAAGRGKVWVAVRAP